MQEILRCTVHVTPDIRSEFTLHYTTNREGIVARYIYIDNADNRDTYIYIGYRSEIQLNKNGDG